MRHFSLFIVCLLLPATLWAQSWDLNDVSYLFPLPVSADQDSLWKYSDQGALGELLPLKVINSLPPVLMVRPEAKLHEYLRVVAVRIDPCFPGALSPLGCQRQVRMIWQPLASRNGEYLAFDGALHSFYGLDEAQFSSLLNDLQDLKKDFSVNTAGLPLSVHPALGNAAFAKSFQETIFKYVGQGNLTEVTAMLLRGANDMWAFLGFKRDADGNLTQEEIPRLQGKKVQSFMNPTKTLRDFEGARMAPHPAGADTFNGIMTGAESVQKDFALAEQEVRAIYRIENPLKFNAKTSDCVSCHVAMSARLWAQRSFATWDFDHLFGGDKYTASGFNLSNPSKTMANTQLLRAFGYDQREPAVADRTIFESAEVVKFIKATHQ